VRKLDLKRCRALLKVTQVERSRAGWALCSLSPTAVTARLFKGRLEGPRLVQDVLAWGGGGRALGKVGGGGWARDRVVVASVGSAEISTHWYGHVIKILKFPSW
jgi:hypothetical protein